MTGEPDTAGDPRVEALLKANAELAAELRSVSLAGAAPPRSAAGPATRRLAKLFDERDALASQLEQQRSELIAAEQRIEALEQEIARLAAHIHEQAGQLERLRSGPAGLFRRVRARLLRR
jgi:chromosome segregation ATPase